jgi:hypothetical protein
MLYEVPAEGAVFVLWLSVTTLLLCHLGTSPPLPLLLAFLPSAMNLPH